MVYYVNMQKLKLRCSGCGKPFKTSQALGNHRNYCRRLKEGPAPASAAPPVEAELLAGDGDRVPTPSEKGMAKKWNPGWSDAEKKRHLLESLAFKWGIERRHGKWQVVPVPGGISYGEAVIAADERNAIDRLFPVRRRVREVEDEDENLALGLLLLGGHHM